MIRLVEKEPERRKLLELCEKTPFGCKISSVATSYGFDKSFACFWLDEETDVVFCLVDGVMLLSGTVLDGEPVRLFLQAVGAKGVLCAVRNAEALGLSGGQSGDVLKRFLLPGESAPPPPPVNIRKIYSPSGENGHGGGVRALLPGPLPQAASRGRLGPGCRGRGGPGGLRRGLLRVPDGGHPVRPWPWRRAAAARAWGAPLPGTWRPISPAAPCMCSGRRTSTGNFTKTWDM